MSTIRKKSLNATIWIYVGFMIGAINTYFFTHKNWFSPDQYGLTRVLLEISNLIFAFSTLGVTSYLYKFFPYYQDNIESKKNDLLAIAFVVSLCGFVLTCVGIFFLHPIIIRKFSTNSILLVQYFYIALPLAFFLLLYNVLEAYSYGFEKGVLTNLLRETVLRLYTFVITVLKVFDIIDFDTFIYLFAFQYALIVFILGFHLYKKNQLWLSFKISRVTRKFRKKIFAILGFTFIVIIVSVLRSSIDGLVLAAKQDLGKVGIFGFAAYMVSVLQAPARSIIAVTIPILSRSWKDKNHKEIERIYKRSSINLLSFALFVFFCIWLNFSNAIPFFGISPEYLEGKWVFFILGMVTIIEMGTGVNGQIIGTSSYWRVELWTSLLLTALIIPLSYYLTVKYGIIGPAVANLVSFSVYNFVRYLFLWKKFHLQPFSFKTLEIILIAIVSYSIAYFLFRNFNGLVAMIGRTALFAILFLPLLYFRNISPDVKPVVQNFLKRLQKK
jgi:O-antigen/teichoic acid export membrane protein